MLQALTDEPPGFGAAESYPIPRRLRVLLHRIYYDTAMTGHSPDPADPAQTTRVLTIMLASEY
jgi:hypothetical protein